MSELNLPIVSIITVVLNNSKHIRGAIESVLSQDYPKKEYIIIDGNSTDGTIEIIEEFGNKNITNHTKSHTLFLINLS